MPNYQQVAAQAARRYGLGDWFVRQIKQESGFNPNARSSAGAAGIAQVVARYHPDAPPPSDPVGQINWAAKYMSGLVKQYGSVAKALSVYNSGRPDKYQDPNFAGGQTYNYVKNILGGSTPTTSVPSPTLPGSSVPETSIDSVIPDLSAVVSKNLSTDFSPTMQLSNLVGSLMKMPSAMPSPELPSSSPPSASLGPHAGGGWGGSYAPATSLAQVGEQFGLSPTSEKRSKKMTTTGGVSDHWTGSKNAYAYDLGGKVSAMDKAARAIAQRLGISYSGGPLVATKTINGLRYQLLYRTNVGGNHFNHIHIGVRRA